MIQRKKKPCRTCGKTDFIFSHGNCKNCWSKQYLKKQMTAKEEIRSKDNKFFELIWATRPHVCFETGEPIKGALRKIYFHHLIPKQEQHKYSVDIRWNEELVVIVSGQTHQQAEQNIDKTPKIKQATIEAREKYSQFKIG